MLIARGNLQLDNDAIIARCYDFLSEHKLEDVDKLYGRLGDKLSSVVMSMYLHKHNLMHLMPHHWPEFQPLNEIIQQQFNGSAIRSSWFNMLPTGTTLLPHNHTLSRTLLGAVHASFVYYPQNLESNMAPLELLIGSKWTPIDAQAGDWLCFGLDCTHRVPFNTSAQHRISFTFDV